MKQRREASRRSTTLDAGGTVAAQASELRTRALTAESEQRLRDAIAAWTALNELQPDPGVETHLVDLRCDTRNFDFDGTPVQPWPRPLPDPFPEVSGRPPEIAADQLTMEVLGGAILHHGCLLVRGLFGRDQVETLRTTIDRAFAAREQHLNAAPIGETAPWYVPCAHWDEVAPAKAKAMRLHNDTCKAVHVADSPRALFQVIDAIASTKVVEVISAYLGEAPVLSVHKTMLRRVPPDASPSFHQDGSFMGSETRAVDIWVTLTECGEGTDAPGLAVLPRRLDATVRTMTGQAQKPLSTAEVAAISGGISPMIPTCHPGDAILFDEMLLHANGGGRPGLAHNRYALEAWMFAPSSVPAPYLPLVV